MDRGRRVAELGEYREARHERTRAAHMSGFSAEWLELREPYDLRARNAAVLDAMFDLLAGKPSVSFVDLACVVQGRADEDFGACASARARLGGSSTTSSVCLPAFRLPSRPASA